MTTAQDINDLIPQEAALVRQLLQEIALHPQVRQPVLRFLLAEDFPALVAMVRENTDNIRLILERLGVVEDAVARIPAIEEKVARIPAIEEKVARIPALEEKVARIPAIEEAVARIPAIEEAVARIPALEEAVARIPAIEEKVARIPALEEQVARIPAIEEKVARIPTIEDELRSVQRGLATLQGSFGRFRGESYENACRQEIAAVLDGFLEWPILADRERINRLLVAARHADRITRAELIDGYHVDIIARAENDDESTGTLAVLEATITFNREDLETASRRADIIARVAGVPAVAYLVTHHDWPAEMDEAARALGVTIISYPLAQYALD